jgi:hypothetical protein
MKYLHNSHAIKHQLRKLFSGNGTKWAVVGFVGYNALDHLPTGVSDLSVVCWPKAGGTNPDGVRRLTDNGIKVYFCKRLHHKVYWRENMGLIVGSANLSDNALGEGRLHEFGVYCADRSFDITSLLSELEYKEVTAEALAKLDVEHTAQARKSGEAKPVAVPDISQHFLRAANSCFPKQWKLVTWQKFRENSEHIQEAVEHQFGSRHWANDNDVDVGSFHEGDFVLQVKVNGDGNVERANARWLLVELVVGGDRNRAVVQVKRLDDRTPPPFAIDPVFRRNLKTTINQAQSWEDIYDRNAVVKRTFVRSIIDLYRTGA